jgi:NADH dehydrogenase (ubiquinone) flavoprotein 2
MSTPHGGPASFAFSPDNLAAARHHIAKYPPGRQASAVMPLLDLAQRQNGGWLPPAAIEYVAEMLDMPSIRVWEVASFYSMYRLRPVGRHKVQVCTTTPCWLMGSDGVREACETALGVGFGGTTADGVFSLSEVECLGACANGPVMRVDDDYYEDLDPTRVRALIDALRSGKTPPVGSQTGRMGSAPLGGPLVLKDVKAGGDD